MQGQHIAKSVERVCKRWQTISLSESLWSKQPIDEDLLYSDEYTILSDYYSLLWSRLPSKSKYVKAWNIDSRYGIYGNSTCM